MENAGISVLKHLDLEKENFLIVCGVGNNGGDGLVVARHLSVIGKSVEVFVVGNLEKATDDFLENKKILDNLKIKIKYIKENNILELTKSLKKADIVLDAIFGTGLKRNVEGLFKKVIEKINIYAKYIVGIDLPSGIDSDTGEVKGICTICNKTVTFGCYKECMIEDKIKHFLGDVYLEKIGIHDNVLDKFHEGIILSDLEMVSKLLPIRDIDGHKGKFGKVLVVAGSRGFCGAAYITTQAAVKTGSGLVTLCTDNYTQQIVSSKLIEAMTCNYNLDKDEFINLIDSCDCVAIGPGLGNNENTLELLKLVLEKHKGKIVIDADGLNVLSNNLELLKITDAQVIITPHPGEMARLIKKDISYVNNNRKKVAQELAKKYNITVLLKGHNTVIANGQIIYINPTGTSAMASGGMGDCLTGIIVSLIGQGLSLIDATVAGTYIHGGVADMLANKKYSVQANDVIENISEFMKRLLEKR